MSFILNALRKSEQERVAQQVETLENKLHVLVAEPKKKLSIGMLLLILVNLIFLAYFVWTLLKTDEQVVYVKQPPVVEERIKIVPQLNVTKIEKPGSISISEKIEKHQVQVKKTPPKAAQQQLKPIKQKQVEDVQESIKSEETLITSLDKESKSNEPVFLSELDYQFRRTVPSFAINVYVYSENEQDRFIMIDMKKYQPGQRMDNGIVLKDIQMDGLVVEYNDRIFRIKRK